jgi:hypothetical protein
MNINRPLWDTKKEKIMSKYEPLWKYLQINGKQTLKLTFEEIKTIVGFNIDHSFLTYKKEAGQVGKISMKEKHITFNKLD